MVDWRDEITGYEIPASALLIETGANGGQHWLHLKTAEQLAKALYFAADFDIRRVASFGGISENTETAPEGFVALYDHFGNLKVIGSYMCGDVQFLTACGTDSSSARRIYEEALIALQENAAYVFGQAPKSNIGGRPSPRP
jgi:hypothetical protein